MKNFLNIELLKRVISVFIYIPIVILPLIYSNYVTVIIFLLFTSIIWAEIEEMKIKVRKLLVINLYLLTVIVSFFLFILLLITGKVSIITLLTLIIIIWLFDTFSFIGGKIIEGKKLMPKISSGKTFSGLATGIFMTLIITEILFHSLNLTFQLSFLFTLSIIFLSFSGDTIVSMLKRYASIKDSGKIMPGHGGLLDRFDSFIAVFFVYGIANLLI